MEPSIRMVFTRDYTLMAEQPCASDRHSFGYWRNQAQSFLARTKAHAVIIVNRGKSSQVRYQPDSDCIMIVPSTSGRYGKARLVRIGKACQ